MLLAFGLLAVVGCAANSKIQRKTVGDLYREALRDSDSRPAVIRPNFNSGVFAENANSKSMAQPPVEPSILAQNPPTPSSLAMAIPMATSFDPSLYLPDNRYLPDSQVQLASSNFPVGPAVFQAVSPALEDKDLVNEIFDQTDIGEAIQVLATNCNKTVVVDDSIGGVTSVQITNEPFDIALAKVLAPLGFYFAESDGTYYVASSEPDSPLFSKIAKRSQYSPVHHDVKSLIGLLPPRFKKYVNSSDTRNLILIDAPPDIGQEIATRIREIDTPVTQVELEAIVCVVSPDSGFRFGLDWNHVVGINGVDSFKAGLTGLTFSGSTSPTGARNAFSDFAVTSAFVRLLAQEGYVTIRAAPRVTTKDGEKANIAINRETFFSIQNQTSSAFFTPQIQKVEAGISLEITPRVHGDMISVQISKAEVSEDIRTSDVRPELTSNPYPIINRRTVSTSVNVPAGHTIVIGGLVQRQTVERINRIPVLSKIPLAGKLFQTIEKQEQDAEVAIFISPKIVVDNYACMEESLSPSTDPILQAP